LSSELPISRLPESGGQIGHLHMPANSALPSRLLAFSDFYVAFPENREIIEYLWSGSAADRLLVACDVGSG
jgi:hypothetical protein